MYAGLVAPFGGRRHRRRRHSVKPMMAEGGRRRRRHHTAGRRVSKKGGFGFLAPLAAAALGSVAPNIYEDVKGLIGNLFHRGRGPKAMGLRKHRAGRHRLTKGSPAAKAFMARIRKMRHGRHHAGAILTPGPLL